MNSTVYAPVVIPTLCRYTHFKRCVESLARNTGADQTELYIGLDYPTKETHWDGYRKLCDYIPTIQGFKNVIVYKRESNFGPMRNARDILAVLQKQFDRYIFSEDDNEFAPNFLQYINEGLNKYRDNMNVIAICGYAEPKGSYDSLKSYPYNAYPIIGYNAWGVGRWFAKEPQLYTDEEIIYSWKNVFKCIRLNQGVAMFRIMKRMRTHATSDLQWRIYCAFHHKYCIFPKVTKVKNWGFDGSGENSPLLATYANLKMDEDDSFEYDDFEIKDYPQVQKLQKVLYGWDIVNYITFPVFYLYFRLTKGKTLVDSKLVRRLIMKRRELLSKK